MAEAPARARQLAQPRPRWRLKRKRRLNSLARCVGTDDCGGMLEYGSPRVSHRLERKIQSSQLILVYSPALGRRRMRLAGC